MQSHLDRADLIASLLAELEDADAASPDPASRELLAFARAVLRRVDDGYLYRHRLVTMGAQLRDSFRWVTAAVLSGAPATRVFQPSAATHGYGIEGQVIETVMADQPFIYDTLKLYMERAGIRVLNALHIVLTARVVDGTVEVVANGANGANGGDMFSYTRWYVDLPDEHAHERIEAATAGRLETAQHMVVDFHRMKRDVRAVANEFEYLAEVAATPRDDCLEVRDFLNWLIGENFVFMGVSSYTRDDGGAFVVDVQRGLGAVRNEPLPSGAGTPETLHFFAQSTALAWPLVWVRKSRNDSILHRRGKVDEIAIRTFDNEGRANGGLVVHGMFTFKGLGEPGGTIPILRRKLQRVVDDELVMVSSYEHKSIVHAFNALPVEYLFEADLDTIKSLIQMSVGADDSGEIRTHIASQPDARSAYAFIVLPKENYSDELRALLQMVLQVELRASYADHRVYLGKYGSVVLHFYLTGDHSFEDVDLNALSQRLVEVGTPWSMRLRRSLEREYGAATGTELYDRYAEAFSEAYSEVTTVSEAVVDIHHLESVLGGASTRFDIFPSQTSDDDATLRIYSVKDLLLTDILPVVDNFGVVVAEQVAFDITPEHADIKLTVNTLRVRRGTPDLLGQRSELIDGLKAVFTGRMRSGRINRLLLGARIGWREVDMFRAYFNYSRQLGSSVTAEIIEKVLLAHAEFVHQLTELFRVRFDPDTNLSPALRDQSRLRIERKLTGYLDGVQGFEEDRVLRMFLNLVEATLRTNFYQPHDDDEHYLSFKFDGARVDVMPDPRSMFEIYVHHAEVEGVHLRGGKVARGGIRWSDRLDDYRSEILGLVTTQMLKNTLIVPVGAKGGFVLKTPPEDWGTARALADERYQIFIRGLLDLTDNIVDGEPVPPQRVICYDEPDPYLVVAADKGTAHLSDTANALSERYGFWLGDAFASGGSVGYDHKEKGITARGAWVCVRRHFLELGIDPERDPVSVVGIGDMSGDVFGNGLLRSQTVQLIAAFNHRHIFLDPNPDPARSFAERQRLFNLGRSSWSMYNMDVISEGGGIFDRGAKSIQLSPEVRRRLNTEERELSGEALIRLVLQAEVDLLWNGGIGTYVKGTSESHADVDDADNDRVRVDASALRCRVIGEGGNLGVTMLARVEFADACGRLNLDAIDNSGGVDLSDHEVNLKMLLRHEVAQGTLSQEDRNALLMAVGDTVCDAVLDNSDGQALAISLDEVRSRRDVWAFFHAMMFYRDHVGFSRRTQHLPRGLQLMRQRASRSAGFLRPELAKLLSYSKMFAYRDMSAQPIGPKESLRPFLVDYFPDAVVAQHGGALEAHILFNEIAATVQINRIVNMAGVTLFPKLVIATERSPGEIAAAYLVAESLLGIAATRAAILAQTDLTLEGRYAALTRLEDHLARATRSLLWNTPGPVSLGMTGDDDSIASSALAFADGLESWVPDRVRRQLKDEAHELSQIGLEPGLARRLSRLGWIDHLFVVQRVSQELSVAPAEAAKRYFAAGFGLGILEIIRAVGAQSYPDRWDNVAVHTITRSLVDTLRRLTESPLALNAASHPAFTEIPGQVAELMRERIPVSAILVLSERIKHRLDRALSEVDRPEAAPLDEISGAA